MLPLRSQIWIWFCAYTYKIVRISLIIHLQGLIIFICPSFENDKCAVYRKLGQIKIINPWRWIIKLILTKFQGVPYFNIK